jgi:O-acetyl-ADP-ribose deacetylase (regulator of RNase III)
MIEIVAGDLFDATEKFLCHQCNCITKKAAHLSKDVFTKYPYADIYSGRITPNQPGTIEIYGNGQDQRYVVNLLGQYYPGTPKYPTSSKDGTLAREKYFHQCLLKLAKVPDLESVAFPFGIGCGAAGGTWEHYLGTLKNFEKYVKFKYNTKVVIYKLRELL